MDRNSIIGWGLILVLFFIWTRLNAPTQEEIAERQRIQDSIAQAEQAVEPIVPTTPTAPAPTLSDSAKQVQLDQQFGVFGSAANGTEQSFTLENEVFKLQFSNKGGRITSAQLKEYEQVHINAQHEEVSSPLLLLEDQKNRFDYLIPVQGQNQRIKSGDLFFEVVSSTGNQITFRAQAGGGYIEQTYSINPNSYNVDYTVNFNGLSNVLAPGTRQISLDWINYLSPIEDNRQYERNFSSIYYKPVDDGVDYCTCTGDDEENLTDQKVKWVSHSNQFFNTSLIAKEYFNGSVLTTEMLPEEAEDLKITRSVIEMPLENGSGSVAMNMYVGPNEFNALREYKADLEYIIPYGWSVFGTINRWVIRPIFEFLSGFIGNMGILILVLTVLVKAVLYPLTYKMLYSQSKMAALKPKIAHLNEKYKDDAQGKQMETMKIYQQFGVNPLGGCFPILLQMPIWFALYRFFPASIEFRQAEFLWATDLSSFDAFMYLPMDIPFYGDHVSLFTILWAGTTVIYTFYNTRHMDMSVNPAMKYMQYFMPVMFLFFFNNYASGLTCYLLFSNISNIAQTIITKNYLIDQEKIQAEFEAYKKKPKKKSGFRARLEEAMKEQQRIQAEKEQKEQKGKKGKKK